MPGSHVRGCLQCSVTPLLACCAILLLRTGAPALLVLVGAVPGDRVGAISYPAIVKDWFAPAGAHLRIDRHPGHLTGRIDGGFAFSHFA